MQLRQLVAEDLLYLVSAFTEHSEVPGWTTYKALKRVLEEQCDVQEERVTVKKQTGGDVMQNPSDPDASYNGHKGPGYQAQISETCSEANEVQLIAGVEVEPAHCSDQDAVEPMLDQLEAYDRQPELLFYSLAIRIMAATKMSRPRPGGASIFKAPFRERRLGMPAI